MLALYAYSVESTKAGWLQIEIYDKNQQEKKLDHAMSIHHFLIGTQPAQRWFYVLTS